jgi:hypothetical protein
VNRNYGNYSLTTEKSTFGMCGLKRFDLHNFMVFSLGTDSTAQTPQKLPAAAAAALLSSSTLVISHKLCLGGIAANWALRRVSSIIMSRFVCPGCCLLCSLQFAMHIFHILDVTRREHRPFFEPMNAWNHEAEFSSAHLSSAQCLWQARDRMPDELCTWVLQLGSSCLRQ